MAMAGAITRRFSLTNAGIENLIIGTIALAGSDNSELTVPHDNCSGRVLSPSITCTIDVSFVPESLGAKGASLEISYNDGEIKTASIAVSGIATSDTTPPETTGPTSTITTTTTTTTNAINTTTTTIPVNEGVSIPVRAGWNLLSSTIDFQVATVFGDSNTFISVWKWADDGTAGKTWAVYLASEDGGTAYAQSKGFIPLAAISSGEGFWANSKAEAVLAIHGTPIHGPLTLVTGWNLLGLKSDLASSVANFTAGQEGIVSIWKWESDTWSVYLPNEEPPGSK